MRSAPEVVEDLEELLRAQAHAVIARKIDPANDAAGIKEELRRPGDIGPAGSGAVMEQVEAAQEIAGLVRQKQEAVALFLRVLAAGLRSVGTDSHYPNAAGP